MPNFLKQLEDAVAGRNPSEKVVFDGDAATLNNARAHFGRKAFLVAVENGRSSPVEVRALIQSCRLNLGLRISDVEVDAITAEGGSIPFSRADAPACAQALADFICRRANVQWYRTQTDNDLPQRCEDPALAELLGTVQRAGLLTDRNGNLSMRIGKTDVMAISPRGVNKSRIGPRDMMVVSVDRDSKTVRVNNQSNRERKPSIDSGVSDMLYSHFPGLHATVHTHSPWAVGAARTNFPYPCGVVEEGNEAIETLTNIGFTPERTTGFLLHLDHHGYLLGMVGSLTIRLLRDQWTFAVDDMKKHWSDIGETPRALLAEGRLQAILSPMGICGTMYHHADGAVSPRILPLRHGKGWGRELVDILHAQNAAVKTVDACNVGDFYRRHGFEEVARDGRIITLRTRSTA